MADPKPEPYCDICIFAPNYPLNEMPLLPSGFSGGILHGIDSKLRGDEAYRWNPHLWWQHSEELDRIVGENNAHFPTRAAQIIDLTLTSNRLIHWLTNPSEWWPLCESIRETSRFLRLHLPRGTAALVGVKKLALRFPDTQFWIDPFVHGPVPGWQGHVRMAEYSNVYLSTLGLAPTEFSIWTEDEAQEALTFTVGEVGASTLMYASGLGWEDALNGLDRPARAWFETTTNLDEEERRLVLSNNAHRLFKDYRDLSSIE